MARAPDGSDMLEVVRFHSPPAGAKETAPTANRPRLRHIAFTVGDVRAVVARIREAGWDTVGEIVDYQNTFLLPVLRPRTGRPDRRTRRAARRHLAWTLITVGGALIVRSRMSHAPSRGRQTTAKHSKPIQPRKEQS
jgi:hypothetical protein